MGWFNKKAGEGKGKEIETPGLPELPKLPDFPKLEGTPIPPAPTIKEPNQLPSFSTKSLQKKFSKNAIKNAVSGEKEDGRGYANEMGESPRMQTPHTKRLTQELEEGKEWDIPSEHTPIPEEFHEAAQKVNEAKPVFIRIDKFQNSLDIFEKIKREVHSIEQKLNDIKHIQDEEEKELDDWQKEILTIKDQISQIDKDVFSRVD